MGRGNAPGTDGGLLRDEWRSPWRKSTLPNGYDRRLEGRHQVRIQSRRSMAIAAISAILVAAGPAVDGLRPAEAASGSSQATHSAVAQGSYSWTNVAVGGGGYVTGLYQASDGRVFAQTDIGGVYRWDATAQGTWVPITDMIQPSADRGTKRWQVEGFAVDPQQPSVIYYAGGRHVDGQPADGAIYRSTDLGATWQRIWDTKPSGIYMNGNGPARDVGNRLVVDPNDSSTVYFASRSNGLWRGHADAGGAWSWTNDNSVPHGTSGEGVAFVAFDAAGATPGAPTPTMYVGVRGKGVYRRTSSTAPFVQETGSPIDVKRGEVAAGKLWVTSLQGVSVRSTAGAWTHHTPGAAGGYNALAVDPTNVAHIVAVQDCGTFNCKVYQTMNAGSTWTEVQQTHSSVPWFAQINASWFSSATATVMFDRTMPQRVWLGDWQGVWRIDDITNPSASWQQQSRGHEELVVTGLREGTDGVLVSTAADVRGFRHTSETTSPAQPHNFTITGVPSDLDSSTSGSLMVTPEAYSTNNGASWQLLGTSGLPANPKAGRVAVNADGTAILWTPSGTAQATYRATSPGGPWSPVSGLPTVSQGEWSVDRWLAADRNNSNVFYALMAGPTSSQVFVSWDKGSHWAPTSGVIPGTTGIADTSRWSIKAAPWQGGRIWVNAGMAGLYRSDDYGASFAKVTSVAEATLLAFGKPATAGGDPTLFLFGAPTGGASRGFFRSTDSGQTWVSVAGNAPTDTESFRLMEGDLNTFGRFYLGTEGRGIFAAAPN
jgi:xyloglucan-specific exo-beta-1,4-glucanase